MADLIGPDGRPYHVDDDSPEKLAQVQKLGYRVVTPEAPQTEDEKSQALQGDVTDTLRAAGKGAYRGLTFGLDPETDPTLSAENKALEEEHPVAAGVGELAGSVLSPVNKVAGVVEGGARALEFGKVAQKVLGGASVGALYGAGNALSEEQLGDPNKTADKVLAHVGLGALLGGAGGGLGHAVEEGVAGLLPSLSKSAGSARDALEDFADNRWLKAAGGIQSDIRKVPEPQRGAVADALRSHLANPEGVGAKSLDEALESVEGERLQRGADVARESGLTDTGELLPHLNQEDALAAVGKLKDAQNERIGEVYGETEAQNLRPDLKQVKGELHALRASLSPVEEDSLGKHITRVERYVDELAAKPGYSRGYAELNKIRSDLDAEIKPLYRAGDTFQGNLRKRLVGTLRDELDVQLAQDAGPDLAKKLFDAKGEASALYRAEDALGRKGSTGMDAIRALAENSPNATPSLERLTALEHAKNLLTKGIERKEGNRWLSASDYLTGLGAGALHGGPLGALTGLSSAVAHKFIREKGAGVVAQLADKLAKSPALQAVADSFGKQLPRLAPQLGDYGQTLIRSLAVSPEAALATHMALAHTDPQYAAAAQVAGLGPESPEQHVAAVVRGQRIAEAGAAAREADKAIDRHLDNILKGVKPAAQPPGVMGKQDFGTKRMRREGADAHAQRVKEVQALAADPDALMERVAGNLRGAPPALASAMSARAATAVSYLAQAAAVPPKGGPLAHDWAPPEADMHDFAQKLEVVEQPMSLLRYAAAGTLTEQQVEALKAVYPSLARDIADRVLEKMAAAPERVSPAARFVLSMLCDVDPDGSYSSAAISSNQTAISASGKKAAAGQGSPKATPARADKLSVASRMATPGERRELDGEEA